jgi:catechol 2,3-dioxygenase-like lactoylglutathione lyase family enzyme
MILGVHHPALAVPSIQAALDFYCGVLGFRK